MALRARGGAGGGHVAGTVAFMGLGEPLLHLRFLDMVRLAKEGGLRVEVTTNALLLDEEMAAGLLDAGLDQLVVSIDGASAEAFGRVRPGASLGKVVENVRRLHDRRGPNYGPGMRIGIEFVAMRSNVRELPGLNRLAAQLGATFIIVSNVLAYTPELQSETLYDHRVTASEGGETTAAPRWQLPTFDWDEDLGAALGGALARSGPVDFTAGERGPRLESLPLRRVRLLRRRLARRRQPVPAAPAHVYVLRARSREADDALGGRGSARRVSGGDLGEARLRRLPRARAPLRLSALYRLRLRTSRRQRRGLLRQPAPRVRRLPLGARYRALRLTAGRARGRPSSQRLWPISCSRSSLALTIACLNCIGLRICLR